MNLTFDTRSMSAPRSNVKFENSTRILSLLVVLLFPTFPREADTNGMQMLETNHEYPDSDICIRFAPGAAANVGIMGPLANA